MTCDHNDQSDDCLHLPSSPQQGELKLLHSLSHPQYIPAVLPTTRGCCSPHHQCLTELFKVFPVFLVPIFIRSFSFKKPLILNQFDVDVK